MKNKKFVHCPKPGCDDKLPGAWKDYLTGEVHPKTGLPVYQCPNCHMKFTADSFKANAIPVTDDNKDIILYNVRNEEILDVIPHTMKFTDGKFHYVHIPLNMCIDENLRCFSFSVKGLKLEEILNLCKEAIRDGVEVYR